MKTIHLKWASEAKTRIFVREKDYIKVIAVSCFFHCEKNILNVKRSYLFGIVLEQEKLFQKSHTRISP